MVAYALEIDVELLEFAPELLADLDVLGSDRDEIVEILSELGISALSTVVDLGCGKGAVSIAIAQALGCHVLGIELFAPFIPIAQAAALEAGVDHLCKFLNGNAAELANSVPLADAVVFAALGDVLGPLDATIATIREYAKPGGYVIVNDCCLRDGATNTFDGFEHYADLTETRRRLTACGDEIVRQVLDIDEDDDEDEDDGDGDGDDDDAVAEGVLIAQRARRLAEAHPDLAAAFHAFAREQQAEYEFLDAHTIGGVWALRRSSKTHH